MALTGTQLRSVLASVGAVGGQIASMDQLANGANAALKQMRVETVDQAAGFLATMVMESAYLRTTKEYGSGQRYAPYIGRTFEQLTWQSNYAAFGRYLRSQGLVNDPDIFVKNPAALERLEWAWLGGVWFWTVPRSNWGQYKSLMDVAKTGSILAMSRAVNVGTPNTSFTPYGMTARTKMFNEFKALGSSILPSVTSSKPSTTTTTSKGPCPVGAIPGTADQVIAAANAMWNKWKGKLYQWAWPGWRELPYGFTSGYWCAGFVSLAFRKGAGFEWRNTVGRQGPAYCPALVAGMKKSPFWTEVSYKNARKGDVVFFFRGTLSYHVGLVEAGPTSAGHDLRTIEGNTSTPGLSSSMSLGGTLAKKVRDDRYASMRIWRPTYWGETTQKPTTSTTTPAKPSPGTKPEPFDPEPTPTPPTDPTPGTSEPENDSVIDERPMVSGIGLVEEPGLWSNPIDRLIPSEAFVAAMRESATRTSKVSAWLGGDCIAESLPLDLNASSVEVSSTDTVRRTARLKFEVDRWDHTAADLRDRLSQPGVKLRVETGFSWGAYSETVPVHDGLCDDPRFDWPTGTISVDSPDCMARIAMSGFEKPLWVGACNFVEAIRFLISTMDDGAQVIDLTGNTEPVPQVMRDLGPSSRIDTVMEMAAAIGAELFKSPVAGYYVLRPIAPMGSPARWHVRHGVDLISLTEHVKWSRVRNYVVAISERADSPRTLGEWQDTDPDSPTRVDGPLGRRVGFWTTSLIPAERDLLESAAMSIGQRLIGGRLDVDWQQLVNPLMEAGDIVDIFTEDTIYKVALDSFTIPLGSQRVAPVKARSLNMPGVT